MSLMNKHAVFEKHSWVLLIGILVMVAIGGLVEIVPLFYLKSTIEKVDGMRPYSPLELAGRNIYIREGCYNCHSQMIRPMRDEIERYGHYSLAAESMYDHPFQWSSKRTGPDLARVGGRYSDQWQREHLINPRSVVPTSIMPGYPFLAKAELDLKATKAAMVTNRLVGVPYTDEQIEKAMDDLKAQANPEDPNTAAMLTRYPKAVARDFDGDPKKLTEMDALVAYMQMLGTLVDFSTFDAKANLR
jgi:cytochrome c oxidase cbb3-type subunit 2